VIKSIALDASGANETNNLILRVDNFSMEEFISREVETETLFCVRSMLGSFLFSRDIDSILKFDINFVIYFIRT
tara:strand:- start:2231 stop:2452 length:222 start_codon:yes stop_codon:yes gene_type:complete